MMRSNTPKEARSRVLVLTGPTGVGKTEFIDRFLSGEYEIINADSIQAYKELEIGSAKPSLEERERTVYHLIDFIDPKDSYTSGAFVRDAERLINEITQRGRLPVVSGGTIYYLRELLYSASEAPVAKPGVREEVLSEIKNKGLVSAYEELKRVDPASASLIHPNDSYRIERALEVFRSEGRPLSSFKVSHEKRRDIDFRVIALTRPKEELSLRLSERVERMFSLGLYEEFKRLRLLGADEKWGAMKAIGYSEFFTYLEGNLSLEDVKESIKTHSRQYAKRQMTFLRALGDVEFFDLSSYRWTGAFS